MEWRRVKNIVIVILLLLNGFLLVLVGVRRSETARYEQSALGGVTRVLSENGIEVAPEAISTASTGQAGSAQRDIDLEAQLAALLLDDIEDSRNLGGGLYVYGSRRGQLSFRSGGEVSLTAKDDPFWTADDPQRHSEELMDLLELEHRLLVSEISDGSGRVVYCQMLDGIPLFSCRIVFEYESGCLKTITGNLLVIGDASRQSEGTELSMPTVLMRFLEDVLNSGDVCSLIERVEPGYLTEQSVGGAIRLEPVWYISTNTADYYVDGLTGQVTRATE